MSLQESPERTGSLSRADEPIQFKEPAERDNSGHVHSLHDNGGEQKIPIRGPRNPEQQETSISGGAVTLSKTDYYVVSQLPSLPEQLRGHQSEIRRCFFGYSNNYALALTYSHAIVWSYPSPTASLSSPDVFTLSIPESCRDYEGPAPLGVLLSSSALGSPGLMIVIPSTGRIVYWETVSSATSLGLSKQKQIGVQASIPGLFSGEYAKDVVNAEPSGIVVTFSSGRVAHLTLRDSQGKPNVRVNFLRNTADSKSVGLLAGIKNVLGGGFWRKDVAATTTGLSHQRGQRDVIIATCAGIFETWDTHWHNGNVLKRQFDIKPDVCRALGLDFVNGVHQGDIRILDFAFTPGQCIDTSDSRKTADGTLVVLILVVPSQESQPANLWVVKANILGEKPSVLSAIFIGEHGIPTRSDALQPKIYVPKTGDTAFVLTDQSVTLLSLEPIEQSPNVQTISKNMRPTFQDSIHFRNGEKYDILGHGFEEQADENHYPACLIMVRGFGVIRVTALPHAAVAESDDMPITAKHKLEQAVFYGSMLGSPLDLVRKDGLRFPDEQIEQASLDISRDLLQSSSKFIPNPSTSLAQHLRMRVKAIDDLVYLLLQQGKQLSLHAWWELLWGAEKLAALQAMWRVEESFRDKYGESTFLANVIEQMNDKFKTKRDACGSESDSVRQWFLHDSYQMEHIIPWMVNAAKPKRGMSSLRRGKIMAEHILQASELSLAALEAAFQYREKHADLYAFNGGVLEDGVLTSGYQGLPEFWTSRNTIYVETGHLLDFELDSCRAWFQKSASTAEAPDTTVTKRVARNCSRHLRVLGQMHRERTYWLSSHEDPKLIDEGVALEREYTKRRKWQLFKLAGIGQLHDAISLAESFRDMSALVELIIELQDQTRDRNFCNVSLGDISDVVVSDAGQCAEKISLYFDRFGEPWADAFFSRQISMGQPGVLFAMRKFQAFVTRFLRKTSCYSRLSWINDVISESDYSTAARSLETLAIEEEPDIWNHHVELSLAKLARLAASEKAPSPSHSVIQSDIERLDNYAAIDAVQEMVYEHILPVLHGAIDQKASIELAIDHFGKSVLKDRPSLHEILCDALTRVVSKKVIGVDQLVDLLTLIDPSEIPEHGRSRFLGREFYLALRVVHLSNYSEKNPLYHVALQKLVWRRCMIRDNWAVVGETMDGFDGDGVNSSIHNTALFRTMSMCLGEGANDPLLNKPFSPSEVANSSSDFDLLGSRFRSHQRDRVIRDLEKENEILRQYIDNGELEVWFRNILVSTQAISSSGS